MAAARAATAQEENMSETFKARTFLHLPVTEVQKAPGDKVTRAELEAAGQSDESIAALLADGAITEDMDADVHPDHQPVDLSVMTPTQMAEMAAIVSDKLGDDAPPEIKALAATLDRGPDDRAVLGKERGVSTDDSDRS